MGSEKRTFHVSVVRYATSSTSVKAESVDEACEIAEGSDECDASLCHQCARTVDMGDIDGFVVYDENDDEVEDSTELTRVRDERDAAIADRDRLRRELKAWRDNARNHALTGDLFTSAQVADEIDAILAGPKKEPTDAA